MKVTIYGSGECPWCKRAVMTCKAKGLVHEYKTIGVDIEKEQLVEQIGEFKTVPQITITANGFTEYVGGFEDFYKKVT